MKSGSTYTICQYTAKPGQEDALRALLAEHGPTLLRLGLRSDEPVVVLEGQGSESHGAAGKFIEIFQWRDAEAMQRAHRTPELMGIWEGIGACCASMDFPDYRVV
ncbi:MAG: hypothetical protein H6736_06695 [Alphaproteobacteria bacterium]|nr:hypothetical protein [Alphaproteobacteria bacterium]MCB9691484.1 hypothetical protein [Alphaproteobacteria bacterium]